MGRPYPGTLQRPLRKVLHRLSCLIGIVQDLGGLDILEVDCARLHQGESISVGAVTQFLIFLLGGVAIALRVEYL